MSVWTLSPLEAAGLWAIDDFDEIPNPFDVYASHSSDHERAEAFRAVINNLDATVTDTQFRVFRILSRPHFRVTAITYPQADPDRGLRLLSGYRDGTAVIAQQHTDENDDYAQNGGSIDITTTSLADWLTDVVALLPTSKPGRLAAVDDLFATPDENRPGQSMMVAAVESSEDHARRSFLHTPRTLAGEFILEKFEPDSMTVIARGAVGLVDLVDDGRYVLTRRNGTTAMSPATTTQLIRVLTDEVSDLKNRHRR